MVYVEYDFIWHNVLHAEESNDMTIINLKWWLIFLFNNSILVYKKRETMLEIGAGGWLEPSWAIWFPQRLLGPASDHRRYRRADGSDGEALSEQTPRLRRPKPQVGLERLWRQIHWHLRTPLQIVPPPSRCLPWPRAFRWVSWVKVAREW